MNVMKRTPMLLVVLATVAGLGLWSGVDSRVAAADVPDAPYREVKPWGPAPAAPGPEWEPSGVAANAAGTRVYFLRHTDPPLLEVDPATGKIVKAFADRMFVWGHTLAVDRDGNVWAADTTVGPVSGADTRLQKPNQAAKGAGHGHEVYKFSPDGRLLLTLGTAGVAGQGTNQFSGPTGIAIAPNGDVFVGDGHGPDPAGQNARVLKFDRNGTFLTSWGTRGTAPGDFSAPHALAFDSKGRLFVADRGNSRIQVFDQHGKYLTEYRAFGDVSGLFIAPDDTLFAGIQTTNSILVGRASDGSVTGIIRDVRAEGIAADAKGNLYAAEVSKRGWRKFVKK